MEEIFKTYMYNIYGIVKCICEINMNLSKISSNLKEKHLESLNWFLSTYFVAWEPVVPIN